MPRRRRAQAHPLFVAIRRDPVGGTALKKAAYKAHRWADFCTDLVYFWESSMPYNPSIEKHSKAKLGNPVGRRSILRRAPLPACEWHQMAWCTFAGQQRRREMGATRFSESGQKALRLRDSHSLPALRKPQAPLNLWRSAARSGIQAARCSSEPTEAAGL